MRTAKHSQNFPPSLLVFPSDLGWMAVVVAGDAVVKLTFGHSSAAAAKKALELGKKLAVGVPVELPHQQTKLPRQRNVSTAENKVPSLALRLQAFASGKPDDFRDVRVAPWLLQPSLTDFQARVLEQCRKIPYGRTVSYAELASKAGSPRAARAVGNCMAGNLIPLLIPCHRVVKSDGRLGSYSAPGGVGMKRRLLDLESKNWPRIR